MNSRCFYCDVRIRERPDVDHFVPWSRFPDDGLDNLVVAHSGCNNERWRVRTREHGADLATVARTVGWRRDDARTLSVARALYLRLPATVRLWRAPSHFVQLERGRIEQALA